MQDMVYKTRMRERGGKRRTKTFGMMFLALPAWNIVTLTTAEDIGDVSLETMPCKLVMI